MKQSKTGFLGKQYIKIYQLPIIERILYISSAIGLTLIPIIALFIQSTPKILAIVLLVAMLIFCVSVYFTVFEKYISLDFNKHALIIKEFTQIKEEKLDIDYIIELQFVDRQLDKVKEEFIINIVCKGFTKSILSWSIDMGYRLVLFNNYNRQKKRLLKFIKDCNEALKEYYSLKNKDMGDF